jgi:hypothetical protein
MKFPLMPNCFKKTFTQKEMPTKKNIGWKKKKEFGISIMAT